MLHYTHTITICRLGITRYYVIHTSGLVCQLLLFQLTVDHKLGSPFYQSSLPTGKYIIIIMTIHANGDNHSQAGHSDPMKA